MDGCNEAEQVGGCDKRKRHRISMQTQPLNYGGIVKCNETLFPSIIAASYVLWASERTKIYYSFMARKNTTDFHTVPVHNISILEFFFIKN